VIRIRGIAETRRCGAVFLFLKAEDLSLSLGKASLMASFQLNHIQQYIYQIIFQHKRDISLLALKKYKKPYWGINIAALSQSLK
jgi:hypothetical protein